MLGILQAFFQSAHHIYEKRVGSEAGSGSFPFLIKVLSGLK